VIARSDFFADALAGGPLAAAQNGPLLITAGASSSSQIDPRVLAEVQRVLPGGGTVYVLGGPLALSPGIDATLQGSGYVVQRIQGANQYATAVAIAEQLGNPATIFEATGLDFADALSAVPAAIASHGAILLTQGATQSPETAGYLLAHPTAQRYAIGGPLAAAGADPGAVPIFGSDLYSTSIAVATTFFANAANYGIATGLDYPDALAGGVFMATGGRSGAMLLVDPQLPLQDAFVANLADFSGTQGYIFGGPLAVPNAVVSAIETAVG
jgi:hypothetical protein